MKKDVYKDSIQLNLFKRRRTIRRYRKRPVERGILRRIFEAGRWAPSAHNVQPWRFILVEESEVKEELARAMAIRWLEDLKKDGVDAHERFRLASDSIQLYINAPLLIIACLTMEDMVKYPDDSRNFCEYLMGVQSLSLALENMLLATHLMGLGAAWYCAPLFCQEIVRKILNIPGNVDPQALITLGYPAETPKAPARMKIKEFIHLNRWGKKWR